MSDNLQIRDILEEDYEKGFLDVLSQLTIIDDISKEEFQKTLKVIKSNPYHFIRVIYDKDHGKIVGAGTLLIEPKFIRNCGMVGHIEDIVVDKEVRGKHLGLKIIEDLTKISKQTGCYKTILNCSVENKGFYEKCGYVQKEIEMVQYHKE